MTHSATNSTLVATFDNDDKRWQAVVERNASAAGHFFYSVRTTGVYCRPGCSSRLPRRDNVQFHATVAAAERAGFRPCKRCRPDTLLNVSPHTAAVESACRLIAESETFPSLDELARAVDLSPSHFHRVFKTQTGLTPKRYALALQSRRIREQLGTGDTVTQAIYSAGFNSSSRFYESPASSLGMSPKSFRNRGRGEVIRFAIGECWLGSILVAATGTGICAILLGDDPAELLRDLQDRFSQAELIGDSPDFAQLVAQVVGLVEAPHAGHNLPLEIRGTAFQQRVWEALRKIPSGTTITYTELARRIGQPAAVRAVAGACAANPLAVAIPCHRVVRTNGELSGYRWGLERKAALLERERS